MKKLLLLLALFASQSFAQPFSAQIQQALRNFPPKYSGDPYVCNSAVYGRSYYNTSDNKQYLCTNAGWVAFAVGSTGLIVDTTAVSGGTAGNIFYHKAGDILGELTTTGSGTVAVLQNTPTLTTPVLGTATATSIHAGTGSLVAGAGFSSPNNVYFGTSGSAYVFAGGQTSSALRLGDGALNTIYNGSTSLHISTNGQTIYLGKISDIATGISISSSTGLLTALNGITVNSTAAVKAGTSTGAIGKVGGTIAASTTSTGNTAATDTSLWSFSVPASSLATNLDTLVFKASGTFGAGVSADKTAVVKYGATTICTTGALAVTSGAWQMDGWCSRTGAATQVCTCVVEGGALTPAPSFTSPTETLSGAVTFDVRGSGTNANDIVFKMGYLNWQSAP